MSYLTNPGKFATSSSISGPNNAHQKDTDVLPKRKAVKLMSNRFVDAISNGVCSACNGYYGPAHGQSVCPTCHAFLYANDLDLEVNVQLASVERESDSDSDHDSGNDEPQEFLLRATGGNNNNLIPLENRHQDGQSDDQESPGAADLVPIYRAFIQPQIPSGGGQGNDRRHPAGGPLGAHHHLHPIRVESLSQQLAQLSLPR